MQGDELNEALLAFLRIGFFIGGGGLVLLMLIPSGSAEFVLSACSAGMGGVIVLGVVAVKRFFK